MKEEMRKNEEEREMRASTVKKLRGICDRYKTEVDQDQDGDDADVEYF